MFDDRSALLAVDQSTTDVPLWSMSREICSIGMPLLDPGQNWPPPRASTRFDRTAQGVASPAPPQDTGQSGLLPPRDYHDPEGIDAFTKPR